MALLIDFLLVGKPLSQQSKSNKHKQAWRESVRFTARLEWSRPPIRAIKLKFVMVYLAGTAEPGDINNFVKPIQDALCGLIYEDDAMIIDVSVHMRRATDSHVLDGLPAKLAEAIIAGTVGIYVVISESRELSVELA